MVQHPSFISAPLKIVGVLAVALGKGDFAGWINNSRVCLRYFSGLWKRTAEVVGGGPPHSLTPPLPQPPIRPRGSPPLWSLHAGVWSDDKIRTCNVLFPVLWPLCEATSGSAQLLRTQRTGGRRRAAFTRCRRLWEGFWRFYLFPFTVPACLGTCGKSTGFTTIHIVPEHWQAERKQD